MSASTVHTRRIVGRLPTAASISARSWSRLSLDGGVSGLSGESDSGTLHALFSPPFAAAESVGKSSTTPPSRVSRATPARSSGLRGSVDASGCTAIPLSMVSPPSRAPRAHRWRTRRSQRCAQRKSPASRKFPRGDLCTRPTRPRGSVPPVICADRYPRGSRRTHPERTLEQVSGRGKLCRPRRACLRSQRPSRAPPAPRAMSARAASWPTVGLFSVPVGGIAR